MEESQGRDKKSHKTLAAGIAVVVVLALAVVGMRKILAWAACSKLSGEVTATSATALGATPTAETIIAARDAAAAKGRAAGLGAVTVEAAFERRTNVQLQTTAHIVIEVHAGGCHAQVEHPLETPLAQEDLAVLAEQGVVERMKAPKGHHH